MPQRATAGRPEAPQPPEVLGEGCVVRIERVVADCRHDDVGCGKTRHVVDVSVGVVSFDPPEQPQHALRAQLAGEHLLDRFARPLLSRSGLRRAIRVQQAGLGREDAALPVSVDRPAFEDLVAHEAVHSGDLGDAARNGVVQLPARVLASPVVEAEVHQRPRRRPIGRVAHQEDRAVVANPRVLGGHAVELDGPAGLGAVAPERCTGSVPRRARRRRRSRPARGGTAPRPCARRCPRLRPTVWARSPDCEATRARWPGGAPTRPASGSPDRPRRRRPRGGATSASRGSAAGDRRRRRCVGRAGRATRGGPARPGGGRNRPPAPPRRSPTRAPGRARTGRPRRIVPRR